MTKREITLAHSPDSDDAFMFYALAAHKVESETLLFSHHLKDIETLNQQAMEGVWDITAVSFHAVPYISKLYSLLPCGSSMGDGYGPILVSASSRTPEQLRGKKIAIPGTLTTAFLVLKLYQPDFQPVVVPFDQIIDAVKENSVDAGLLIHEGQLTYNQDGLHRVLDLGVWWKEKFGLPLPLGGNAVRKALPGPVRREIATIVRRSIQHALDYREEALAYALQFARGMETPLADRFVGMYVNDYTLDYGRQGREAIQKLLQMGHEQGLISAAPQIEFEDSSEDHMEAAR
ncbi:MAG: ABC transporter substrate-binding protein [Acidobacteria bacterium]|nr:ABC transporter substrate-binding protein [Acidobacteriota bacterium]